MLRTLSIGKRIVFILTLMVVFIIGISVAFYVNSMAIKKVSIHEIESLMYKGQKAKLKVATDSLALSLGKLIKKAPNQETKISMLREAISGIRFEDDKSGYYFIFNGTTTIAHAAKPSLHGKDLASLKDKNGTHMIAELAKAAASGGGFVEYVWAKPEAGDQPKLSYSSMIPGTTYNIGTGVYIDNIEKQTTLMSGKIDHIVQSNTFSIMSVLIAVLIGVIILSLFIIRSITGPIKEATQAAETIAQGDYSVVIDVKGRDEASQLQASLNSMAETLKDNIKKITLKSAEAEEKANAAEQAMAEANEARAEADISRKKGIRQAAERIQSVVDRVSVASEQISAQAQIIDNGTTIQRDRVQETATAMEEMNATVLEVARNASEAAAMGEQAKERATDGSEIVGKSVSAMNTTYKAAETLKEGMNLLGKQADDIGAIMQVIEDIADQTNLLALNAAIEAARAGEAGRGFAVVADEVRKLAEKTMDATKQVGSSISGVQGVAKQNIEGMDTALSDLSTAVDLSNQSGEVLEEIVHGTEESASQIQSIATAAEEQSATSEEINRSIDEINSISAETSQGVTQSAEALTDMTAQMHNLQQVIDNLMKDAAS